MNCQGHKKNCWERRDSCYWATWVASALFWCLCWYLAALLWPIPLPPTPIPLSPFSWFFVPYFNYSKLLWVSRAIVSYTNMGETYSKDEIYPSSCYSIFLLFPCLLMMTNQNNHMMCEMEIQDFLDFLCLVVIIQTQEDMMCHHKEVFLGLWLQFLQASKFILFKKINFCLLLIWGTRSAEALMYLEITKYMFV